MIKFLFKSLLVVMLLLLIIPMCKLLMLLVSHLFSGLDVFSSNPWVIATFAFLGLLIFFMVIIIKD